MNPKLAGTPARRITVIFSGVVWDWLQEQMEKKGFNGNVSAYLSDLVRNDRERTLTQELHALQLNERPVSYRKKRQ